jgi:endoglucanase
LNKLLIIFWCFSSYAISAQMTNVIDGIGPKHAIKPYICVQNSAGKVTLTLAPGESSDANLVSTPKVGYFQISIT